MNRFCTNHINLINASDTQFLHLKIIEIVAKILNLASLMVQWVKNPLANARDTGSIPGSGSSPGEGNSNPLQLFLPEKSQGQRSLMSYSPWGRKESDMTE